MPTEIYTMRFHYEITFLDATGVTFTRKDSLGSVIEVATNVQHVVGTTSPADSIQYQLDWAGEVQGGDDADIIEYNYDGLGNYIGLVENDTIPVLCYTGYPSWQSDELLDVDWIVGQDVGLLNLNLNNNIVKNEDVPGTTILVDPSTVSPTGGFPNDVVLNADGSITGVVQDLQGGTHKMAFDAANSLGHEVTKQDVNIVVALPIKAPVIGGVPDVSYAQEETITVIALSKFVTDDGDPLGTAVLKYFIDSGVFPLALFLIEDTGRIFGDISGAATVQDYPMVIRCENADDPSLFDTVSFTITVTPEDITPAPIMAAAYTGQVGCSVSVAPTWKAGGDTFFREVTNLVDITPIDTLALYLASDGGTPVTAVSLGNGTSLPAGLTLDTDGTGLGLGLVSGHYTAGVVADISVQLIADNGAVSEPSPILLFSYFDEAAAPPPEFLRIEADAGSTEVRAIFNENVFTPAGDAASYELGWVFEVNSGNQTPSYVSGGGSKIIIFNLTGASFTAGVTITATFTAT